MNIGPTGQKKGLSTPFLTLLTVFFITLALPGAGGVRVAYAQDITTGLVGHWKFDETTGTAAANEVVYGSGGTLEAGMTAAAATTAGKVNTAFNFNGSSDYIDLNDDTQNLSGSMTISAWVKPNSWGVDEGGGVFAEAIMIRKTSSNGFGFGILDDNGNNALFLFDSTNGQVRSNNNVLQLNQWQLVSVVISGGTATFYVNGQAAGSAAYTLIGDGTNVWTDIGVDEGLTEYFNGTMDDVRMYSRALSAADIAALYSTWPGNIRYNADARVPEYHDGTGWVPMGAQAYVPKAVELNGASDYLVTTAGSSGVSDSKMATGSFWFRRNGGIGVSQVIQYHESSSRYVIEIGTDNTIRVYGDNSTGSVQILWLQTTPAVTDQNWHHFMYSFDLSDPMGTSCTRCHFYLDDVDTTPAIATYTDDVIDFADVNVYVGSDTTDYFNGDIADFWFDTGTYIDLSNVANRRKFISASGSPVDLGSNGEKVTGSAPDIFLSGDATGFATNKGTGGGFTLNGTLADIAGPNVTGYNLKNGLAAYWKLDEASGTFADSTGNGNAGTASGGITYSYPAMIGTGTDVDGVSGTMINFGTQPLITSTSPVSISFWVNIDDYDVTNNVLDFATDVGEGFCVFITGLGGFQGVSFGTHSQSYNGRTAGDISAMFLGKWRHVVLTYDGVNFNAQSSYKVYVDGTSYALTGNGGNGVTDNVNRIGSCNTGQNWWFDGKIDDVRVYDHALSESDVKGLYHWGAAHGPACTGPARDGGTIIYNADNDVMQFCDGANWKPMGPVPGAGGAGCTNPSRGAGSMVYNADHGWMQYCDGANWVRLGGAGARATTDGLVGWWKLDDASGQFKDSSDYGNNGTPSGGVSYATSGIIGAAAGFDGSSGYIDVGNPAELQITGDITIAAWVRFNSFNAGAEDDHIAVKFDGVNTNRSFALKATEDCGPTTIALNIIENAVPDSAQRCGATTLSTGQYYHVTGVYNATNQTIDVYLNGVLDDGTLVTSPAVPASIHNSTANFTIGARSDGANAFLDGNVDDVRVYNRALSAAEVRNLYLATGGTK